MVILDSGLRFWATL